MIGTQRSSLALFFPLLLFTASAFASSSSEDKNEQKRMQQRLLKYGFKERSVIGDGNCLMRAISDQIDGTEKNHKIVREKISKWLSSNENFQVDSSGTKLVNFLDTDTFPSWKHYCYYMSKDQSWGDHLALIGASEVYQAKIWILSSVEAPANSEPVTIIEPVSKKPTRTMYLSNWHDYHFNSLEKIEGTPLSKL